MSILLSDEEIHFIKPRKEKGYAYEYALNRAQLKKAFELLDEIIYYREDAPYKTTIDWDKYQEFKNETHD